MFISREQREQFKTLSKEIFGSTSRWQRYLDNGVSELVTKTEIETVPGENGQPDTTKEVKVPVLFNGVKQYKQRYFTVETLMPYLLELKAKRDEFLAMVEKMKQEDKAKKEAAEQQKQVQEELGGSALT